MYLTNKCTQVKYALLCIISYLHGLFTIAALMRVPSQYDKLPLYFVSILVKVPRPKHVGNL
jgi:hypothetical protein